MMTSRPNGADELGQDGSERGTGNAEMAADNQNQVEAEVQNRCRQHEEEALLRVLRGRQNRATAVIDVDQEQSGQVDPAVEQGTVHQTFRHADHAEDRRKHRDADYRNDYAAQGVEREHGPRRLCQQLFVLSAHKLRDDDFDGHFQSAGDGQEHHDHVGGIADRGKLVRTEKTADDRHVDDAVQLRHQHAERDRQGEQSDLRLDFS